MDIRQWEALANDMFPGLMMFVRDTDLPEVCLRRYHAGMILQERGFTDASRRVMGMVTKHRYAILSNHMASLEAFEEGRGWGLHVAAAGSHFKVLDIFEYLGKTQLLLLHLPDDERWKLLENASFSIEEELIRTSRQRFMDKCVREPAAELARRDWLDRCVEPLGMDRQGNLFEL